jgi:hypothetical protein
MGKRGREAPAPAPADDAGLGGLYDFLPPPDPEKDKAAQEEAAKKAFSRPKLPPEDRSRVIFLDVDGVLLPSGSVDTIVIDGVALPTRDTVRESDFSTSALGNLRSIVQQTGAGIVLSSEWRRGDNLKASIAAVLKSQDIPGFRGFTPIFKPREEIQVKNPIYAWCERRAREIGAWLKDNQDVTAWVALDDLDFSWADSLRTAGTPWVKVRSVHTDDKKCLTDEGGAQAVQILLNPPPDPAPKVKRARADVPEESNGLLVSTEDSGPDRIRLG